MSSKGEERSTPDGLGCLVGGHLTFSRRIPDAESRRLDVKVRGFGWPFVGRRLMWPSTDRGSRLRRRRAEGPDAPEGSRGIDPGHGGRRHANRRRGGVGQRRQSVGAHGHLCGEARSQMTHGRNAGRAADAASEPGEGMPEAAPGRVRSARGGTVRTVTTERGPHEVRPHEDEEGGEQASREHPARVRASRRVRR